MKVMVIDCGFRAVRDVLDDCILLPDGRQTRGNLSRLIGIRNGKSASRQEIKS
jgi:hypothetical protein